MPPDLDALAATLRRLLPEGCGVAATDPTAPHPVWPGEAITAIARRQTEFAAGRAAARAAMTDLGLAPASIPRNPDRSPHWPKGVAGSITHSATACLAAVTAAPGLIGIDLEPATPLDDTLRKAILRPEEQDADPLSAKLIFSVKEAVYKAQYPVSQTLFGFHTLAVTLAGETFRATFRHAQPGFPQGTVLQGHVVCTQNHILSVVAARRG